jgi:hypothetical protein
MVVADEKERDKKNTEGTSNEQRRK